MIFGLTVQNVAFEAVHRLLQSLLGLPVPSYHHHRLILDAEGRKLSKSTRATALRELRAQGATADDIRLVVGLPEKDLA